MIAAAQDDIDGQCATNCVLLYPLYRHIPVCYRIHYAYEINQVSYSIT